MERTITFQVPEGLAGVDVRADTQVAIHAGDWMAFRDAAHWLVGNVTEVEDLAVEEGSSAIWVRARVGEVRYVIFAPATQLSLDITPKEYAELALSDALLRP